MKRKRRRRRAGRLNNPHDKLFKSVFGRPEHATDLVRSLLPELAALGMSALEPMPTSSVDDSLHERFSDLCFGARLRPPPHARLCVMLEHKSSIERFTALSVSRHVIDIATDHARARPGQRLPWIIPIVVYHGSKQWNAPRAFEALSSSSRRTRKQLRQRTFRGSFVLYDAARDSTLLTRDLKPLATLTLWLLVHARSHEFLARLGQVLHLLDAVLHAPQGIDDFVMLLRYSLDVADVSFEELDQYLSDALGSHAREAYMTAGQRLRREGLKLGRRQGLKRGRQQGLERGLEQGLEQGQISLFLMQLEHRFGAVPRDVRDKVEAATSQELQLWARRLLSADSLDEVFAPNRP